MFADHSDDVFKLQGPSDFLQSRLFLRIAPDPGPNFFQELLSSEDESRLHLFQRGILMARADGVFHVAPV